MVPSYMVMYVGYSSIFAIKMFLGFYVFQWNPPPPPRSRVFAFSFHRINCFPCRWPRLTETIITKHTLASVSRYQQFCFALRKVTRNRRNCVTQWGDKPNSQETHETIRARSKGKPVEETVQNTCVCTWARANDSPTRERLVMGRGGGDLMKQRSLEQTMRCIFKSFTFFFENIITWRKTFIQKKNIPFPPVFVPYIRCSFILMAEKGSGPNVCPQQGG